MILICIFVILYFFYTLETFVESDRTWEGFKEKCGDGFIPWIIASIILGLTFLCVWLQ